MSNQKGNIALVVLGAMALIIGLSVVGTAMGIITLPWRKLNRQVETNQGIIDKTYNAENALYNYEWFKQTAQDIKATETKTIDAKAAVTSFEVAAGPRASWTFEDKTEDARLRAVAQGLQNHYTQLVADYNARASQANRAIFKDDLPLFFSLNPF